MKGFFSGLRKVGGSVSTEIIEKDFYLHRLLYEISHNDILKECLVFKGGTCLVKAYAGYYRFSEDIDFTRRQDDIWQRRMKRAPSRQCSLEISSYLIEFKEISQRLGLAFSGDKSNDLTSGGDVNIRGGGRMVDFWLKYKSELSEIPAKIKVQINLVDLIEYPVSGIPLKSYVDGINLEGLRPLYREACDEYSREIILPCYDSREIFTEKCRAAMTRIVYKPRDILDIYVMEREFSYSIEKYRASIVRKTRFMLDMYSKYRQSIAKMEFPDEHVLTDVEEKLLLKPVAKDFNVEAVRIHNELKALRQEILSD